MLAHEVYGAVYGDEQERNQLLLEQLPQVRFIARRIHERLPQHVPFEDLVHAGVLGLVDAFNKYDHHRNVQFKSYASFRIRGAILDSLREMDWGPRDLRRKARKLSEVSSRLGSELGRPPTDQEMSIELGMEVVDYQHLLSEIRGLEIGSLPLESERSDGGEASYESIPGDPEDNPFAIFANEEMHGVLVEAISELPEKHQQVLALYYYEELTMKEVGEVLGIGESRVSQIHSSALSELRSRLQAVAAVVPSLGAVGNGYAQEQQWRRF